MSEESTTGWLDKLIAAPNSGKKNTGLPQNAEETIALMFAERHHHELAHVSPWSRWLFYDGTRWTFDDTLNTFDRCRSLCREVASQCNKAGIARTIASAKTVAAIERLARADRRIAAATGQWDADAWLLNTPGGTVDLCTGKMRPHDSRDYVTKLTGAAPDPSRPIPVWLEFLRRVTNGDHDLVAFLQRMSGYMLTGSTREHALFFAHGSGANGKSTFVNAISRAAGDYAQVAPIETFINTSFDRHPTDLAGLRGARLVTVTETEQGKRWSESKLKSLTGGDPISARFMRQDFFTYTPQFKLLVCGNHRPGLRSVDEAVRRRFNLIPFTVTIPPAERDEKLPDKLDTEMPGILAWMVEGAVQWQAMRLAPPAIVLTATATYLEAEDSIAAWIEERCRCTPDAFGSSSDLFKSWSDWATASGEYVGSKKRFAAALETRGFTPERTMSTRGFRGVRLAVNWERTGGDGTAA